MYAQTCTSIAFAIDCTLVVDSTPQCLRKVQNTSYRNEIFIFVCKYQSSIRFAFFDTFFLKRGSPPFRVAVACFLGLLGGPGGPSPKVPEGPRRSPKVPEGPRRSPKVPEGPRRSPKVPEGPRRSPEGPPKVPGTQLLRFVPAHVF